MQRSGKARRGPVRIPPRKTRRPEVEIKLPIDDRQAMLAKLRHLKAKGGKRVHEMNTLYDKPDRTLLRQGKMIRIRVETPAPLAHGNESTSKPPRAPQPAILTYKEVPRRDSLTSSRYKIREEQEASVEDALAMARILENFGLVPSFRYEKYRSTFRLPPFKGLLVELDETPIGDFLELEGSPELINRAAALLGFRPQDYITKSYSALFFERQGRMSAGSQSREPGAPAKDMLFPPRA